MTKHDIEMISTAKVNNWEIALYKHPKSNVYGKPAYTVTGTEPTGATFILDYRTLELASKEYAELFIKACKEQDDKLYLCQTYANGIALMEFVVEASSRAEAEQIGLEHFEGLTRLSRFNLNIVQEFEPLHPLKKRFHNINWDLYMDGGCFTENGSRVELITEAENISQLDNLKLYDYNIESLRKLHQKSFVLKNHKF